MKGKLLYATGEFAAFLNATGELQPRGDDLLRYQIPKDFMYLGIKEHKTFGKHIIIFTKLGNIFVFESVAE